MGGSRLGSGKYSDITVILPTLNEEKNIGELVLEIKKGYPQVFVLVADDGSRDNTLENAKKARAEILDRKNEEVKGITASVLDALALVDTEYFVVMDSDFQHPPEKIGEILSELEKGKDLVIGWRERVPNWGLHRRIISLGADFLGKMRLTLFGNPVPRDIMSGFFGGRTEFVKASVRKNPKRFVGKGYKVLFDLIKGMKKGEVKIAEVPYVFGLRERGASKIGIRHILFYLESVFR